MRALPEGVRAKRDELILQQVTERKTSPSDIAKAVADKPEFSGLTRMGIISDIRNYLLQNGIANEKKLLEKRRREIIAEKITEAYEGPAKSVDTLITITEFQGVSRYHLTALISEVARERGIVAVKPRPMGEVENNDNNPPGATPGHPTSYSADTLTPSNVTSKTPLQLDTLSTPRFQTIGDMAEFQRWLRVVLRPALYALEREAKRVPELEQKLQELTKKVAELERHRCPDADAKLREENERLNAEVARLGRRVEALSKLTAPRDVSAALAVNGD